MLLRDCFRGTVTGGRERVRGETEAAVRWSENERTLRKRVRRAKEKEGLEGEAGEARKDCVKENERLVNSRSAVGYRVGVRLERLRDEDARITRARTD